MTSICVFINERTIKIYESIIFLGNAFIWNVRPTCRQDEICDVDKIYGVDIINDDVNMIKKDIN